MRRLAAVLAVPAVLAVALAGCTPRACNHGDERALAREVDVLIGEPGPLADEAERRLLARGSSAIAVLETGLYAADAAGRRRVAQVLAAIGDPEALPILEHLVAHDDDPSVKQAARSGLAKLRQAR